MQDERRDFPRLLTEHSVELVDADGAVFPTLALDVSLTGMQLLCDKPTAHTLVPDGDISKLENPNVDVRLRITLRDGTRSKVRASAEIVSIRAADDDEYRIGLKYRNFFGDSYQTLELYIDESLPE